MKRELFRRIIIPSVDAHMLKPTIFTSCPSSLVVISRDYTSENCEFESPSEINIFLSPKTKNIFLFVIFKFDSYLYIDSVAFSFSQMLAQHNLCACMTR